MSDILTREQQRTYWLVIVAFVVLVFAVAGTTILINHLTRNDGNEHCQRVIVPMPGLSPSGAVVELPIVRVVCNV